ncbi:DUF4381 domain-containing protein [Paraburkholderia sp.]|uniref:DUF4381 domain-containing protein n=1 Tax=Paraburkholderia sp. TaxID=1926495 RepID=UPI00238717F0|nr:DUF4381 domain-containing protein [Paraburkholderia sp.]MDE1180947.1 DUF4381 domain-containing protein [Paraburkholderia sp.]
MSTPNAAMLVPRDTPAALQPLRESPLPAPVSYAPQTIGWVLIGVVLIALLLALGWRGWRRYERARYRRDALAALDRIDENLNDDATRAAALAEIAPLLKRTALASASRERVASLSGPAWLAFLRAHGTFDADSGTLLYTASYATPDQRAAITPQAARRLAQAARSWIEHHHVEV